MAKLSTKKTTAKPVVTKTAATAKKKAVKKTVIPKKTVAVKKTTTVPKSKSVPSVDVIAQAMLDKKAQEVAALDLTALGTAICDHFMVCHADSSTQVQAIADNVEKEMYEQLHEWPLRVQGKENAFWIIVDYGDVVVHIFQTEYRRFYRLEELWADAEQKKYSEE